MSKLYHVEGFQSLFADAVITDAGCLVFGSFFGRDTVLLQFFAEIASAHLKQFEMTVPSSLIGNHTIYIDKPDDLKKNQIVLPSTPYGRIVHCWIYDSTLMKTAGFSKRAVVVGATQAQAYENALNRLFTMTNLPIQKQWLPLIGKMQGTIVPVWNLVGEHIFAYKVELPGNFEDVITQCMRSGFLKVS